MYNHLLDTAFFMQLKAIEACSLGQGTIGTEKSEASRHIFAAGEFPPIQIKIPASAQYTPSNLIDKDEIKQRMLLLIEKMREAEAALPSISSEQRYEHPRLGYLQATEWFQLVAMHFLHHLRQKERLDQFIQA
jgi:hypothetical protein